MAIVNADDLNDFMSNPEWTEEQKREADRTCRRVESSLAAALGGAPIDPIPWTETANILEKGLVATRYPVFSVQKIGDTVIAADDPLPEPYVLQGHWLRLKPSALPGGLLPAPRVTSSNLDGLAGLAGFGSGTVMMPPRSPIISEVDIEYMAGWGPEGALELAILLKTEAIFGNRNSDTVKMSGTDTDKPPPKPKERWTDEELKTLEVYRTMDITR